MKRTIYAIMAVISLLAVSCAKDGDMLTATMTGDGTQIGSTDDDIVLNKDLPASLALTIWWDELGNATLSDPDAQFADNFVVNAIQFSATGDFAETVETVVDNGASSIQFTTSRLNSILTQLGFESGKASPLYIRMRTSLGTGSGAEEILGEPLRITVTPYFIDMSFITLAGTKDDRKCTIPATEEDGSYAGFVSVPHTWWNFRFVEGDDTVYGGAHQGETAITYVLSTANDMWECWFPEGETGSTAHDCYHVTMDREEMEWSALILRKITMTVGTEALEMEFVPGKTAWTCVLTTEQDNAAIQLDGEGSQYDRETTNESPTATDLSFTASSDNSLAIGNAGAATGISVARAGQYTLILYLADMEWELAEGEVDIDDEEEDPVEWPEDPDYTVATSDFLYLYNLDGNTPSSVAGRLGRTSDGVYEGFQYLGSWQNFKLGDNENPASAKIYGSVPSDALQGALYRLYCGEDMFNIWYDSGEAACLYLTVDMNGRSWSHTVISSISLVGNFNDWDASADVLAFDPDSRTWSAVVTPGSWGEHGIQFYINGSWEWKYSPDGNGKLIRAENAAIPETSVEEGKSYTVTIDLNDPENMTYTIEEYKEGTEPEYNEFFYMFYTWTGSDYWQERLAATLWSPGQDGVYTGFFSTADSWEAPYAQFTFGSVAEPNSGTKYGLDNNTAIVEGGGSNGWTDNLGLYEITASLADMTISQTHLGKPAVEAGTGNSVQMAFNITGFVWEATCTFNAGDSFRITAGEGENVHDFGGADGELAEGGNAITVTDAGTYLVQVDLGNASHLTYTMTKQ